MKSPNSDSPIISFNEASIYFFKEEKRTITSGLKTLYKIIRNIRDEENLHYALRGVSFDIYPGEVVGFIGPNGAGKTTLLKMLAGILMPDDGRITCNGRVSSLIDLGAGFNPYLTGYENIYLHGALLGFGKKQINDMMEGIIEFSGIGEFLDQPVNTYSMGMQLRLGFSIATAMVSEILVVDEVLSVGDAAFQRKCLRRMKEFHDSGKTIILVTHDMSMVSNLCDRVFYLSRGEVVHSGNPAQVVRYYLQTYTDELEAVTCVNENLTLVFQSGKAFLFTDILEITKSPGISVNLLHKGHNYPSQNMNWVAEKTGNHSIKAKGSSPLLPLELTFNFELHPDGVDFDVICNLKEPCGFENVELNIPANELYDAWVAGDDTGKMPSIGAQDVAWHDVMQNNYRGDDLVLVCEQNEDGALPAISFENTDDSGNTRIKLLNSDYTMNARVIQVNNAGFASKSAGLSPGEYRLFGGRMRFKNIEGKKLLSAANKRKRLENGMAALELSKSRLSLSFGEMNITGKSHLYFSIKKDDTYYSSMDASWRILEKSGGLMKMSCRFERPDVELLIDATATGRNAFEISVSARIEQPLTIQELALNFMVNAAYDYWISGHSEGRIPPINPQAMNWHDVVQKGFQKQEVALLAVEGGKNKKPPMPKLHFSAAAELGQLVKLFNSEYAANSRILNVLNLGLSDSDRETGPGEYNIFKCKFDMEMADAGGIVRDVRRGKSLSSGAARIELADSRLSLSYNGTTITDKLAVYASIKSGDRFFDSSNADWGVIEKTDEAIVFNSKFHGLPLELIWTFTAAGEGEFIVEVAAECKSAFPVSREQFNAMILAEYDTWRAHGKEGRFPQTFNDDFGGDWQILAEEKTGAGPIMAAGEKLPRVCMDNSKMNGRHYLDRIINSDKVFQAHVLQCVRVGRGSFPAGSSIYYAGTITVSEKDL